MEPHSKNFARKFSQLGVKARTYERTAFCVYCKEPFLAKSGKAKYCSKSCLNKGWYLERTDAIYSRLIVAHKMIDSLIGRHNHIDPELKKVSLMLDLIERELKK